MAKCKQCGDYGYMYPDSDICGGCKAENDFNAEEIEKLQNEGHPYHCACRQVWGDGECECGLYQKGYDPYAWTKR
jgi:hypothetical protein